MTAFVTSARPRCALPWAVVADAKERGDVGMGCSGARSVLVRRGRHDPAGAATGAAARCADGGAPGRGAPARSRPRRAVDVRRRAHHRVRRGARRARSGGAGVDDRQCGGAGDLARLCRVGLSARGRRGSRRASAGAQRLRAVDGRHGRGGRGGRLGLPRSRGAAADGGGDLDRGGRGFGVRGAGGVRSRGAPGPTRRIPPRRRRRTPIRPCSTRRSIRRCGAG